MEFNAAEMKKNLFEFEKTKDISIDKLDEIERFLEKYEYITRLNLTLNKFGYKNIYEFRRAYLNGEKAAGGYCCGYVFSFINRCINSSFL